MRIRFNLIDGHDLFGARRDLSQQGFEISEAPKAGAKLVEYRMVVATAPQSKFEGVLSLRIGRGQAMLQVRGFWPWLASATVLEWDAAPAASGEQP